MREIKFRAWDKENKEMTNRNFYVHCSGSVSKDNGYGETDSYLNNVNYELMQYTGLKDHKGKEIYEGDIILMLQPDIPQWRMKEDRKILQVKWDQEYANWYLQRIDKKDEDNPTGRWSLHLAKDMELIGNIYENTELLKD